MSTEFQKLWVSLDADGKRELAANSDTSVPYLSQVANGQRRAGTKTIRNLVKADARINFEMFFGIQRPEDRERQTSAQ